MTGPEPVVTAGTGSLRRSPDARVVAGVCGGIAESLGWHPWTVRIGYSVLTLLTGILPGAVAYVVLWKLMPARQPLSEDAKALGMFVEPDDPYAGWER